MLAVVYLVCQSAITINAIPVDNDSAELIMKIEKVNEQLPGNDTEKKDCLKTQPEGRFFTKWNFSPISRFINRSNQIAALAKQKNDSSIVADESKAKKKTQRNYPVYYVNTQVNGKFGKSVRALTSMELSHSELAEVAKWR